VTLVHVTDALAHEVAATGCDAPSPLRLDDAWLADSGVAASLDEWRILAREVSEARS
jgi:hypothetical protein